MPQYTVVKIGGHVLFKDGELDLNYLKRFRNIISEAVALFDGMVIVVGGGALARKYISWGKLIELNESILDDIGIRIARVNASLLWAYYHGVTPPRIPETLNDAVNALPAWKVVFVGGFQPGQSTTTVAALIAEALKAAKLVIATDVDGIYESDPKINPEAKKLDEVPVTRIENMFAKNLRAGQYKLLDPLTISIIARSKIETHVVNGNPPDNILKVLQGEKIGTRIVP
ncbi:MAG: UMP kinase [Thermofilaceae archaeon]|nr:UMP kinase [Thermofilaceae archaeon]MCX8180234.1 UMP kinase [Thermofilaceae archaeon]MDW8003625.1 UMP kinase [Thermofilaceae archaeon]